MSSSNSVGNLGSTGSIARESGDAGHSQVNAEDHKVKQGCQTFIGLKADIENGYTACAQGVRSLAEGVNTALDNHPKAFMYAVVGATFPAWGPVAIGAAGAAVAGVVVVGGAAAAAGFAGTALEVL
ncbi:MAG: hypothetical protein HC848_08365 [Limnobacter sp.]|nr:hypothetical protein [Limnobacter sp.]